MTKRKSPSLSPRKLLSAVSKKLSPLSQDYIGQEESVTYLLEMVTRTVEKGESNSLLVLGPRGVGKSALVNHVLKVLVTLILIICCHICCIAQW